MASAVRDLELDLDAFEGPFDLLLTLLLKDAIQPAEIDMAGIVVAFVERLAERDELDLDACGEFLVLIAALLELKARHLFPDEEAELAELEPEEAAEELARRLAEYRRMKLASAWLREQLDEQRGRFFRIGPAPLAPEPERRLAAQEPLRLVEALRALAVEPPHVSLSHLALRFPPVAQFVQRFRALLQRRRRFDFDTEVQGLSRVEQAVAFLALLELRKDGEIAISQAAPFAPIRISRAEESRHRLRRRKDVAVDRPLRLISASPVDALARTLEALLVVASQPLTLDELAEATADDPERIETALGLLRERYSEGRSGIVLQKVAGGYAFGAAREAAEACARLFERPIERGLSQAALETVAIVAYLGPVSRPEIAAHPRRRRRLGRRVARRARADRRGRPRERPRRGRPLSRHLALRARLRARVARRPAAARRHRRGPGRDPRPAARGGGGTRS